MCYSHQSEHKELYENEKSKVEKNDKLLVDRETRLDIARKAAKAKCSHIRLQLEGLLNSC